MTDGTRREGVPLITTDSFKFCAPAIRLVFGPACVLGQVIKEIRKNRVVRVATRLVIGSEWRLEEALIESEDSTKLSTAFIERLNLTIRQGSAYLNRRSPCHAREKRTLEEGFGRLRCHYNSCRRHSALRFGREVRAPAMQAELATRKLSLLDIFTARLVRFHIALVGFTLGAYQGRQGEIRCAA